MFQMIREEVGPLEMKKDHLSEQNWRLFYEQEAEEYDFSRYGTCYGQLFRRLHHEALIDLLGRCIPGRVLDVAAGTGHVTLLLAKMGFDVTALDLTERMLSLAKKKLKAGSLRANLSRGNAFKLPFADQTFQLVVSTRFLHLWPYRTQQVLLAEMTRVMVRGGILIVDFDNWWHHMVLRLPIFIYQKLSGKGRKVGEHYNRLRKTIAIAELVGLSVKDIRGIAGYHLFMPAICSQMLAMALGRINGRTPLRVFSEQFILKGQKN